MRDAMYMMRCEPIVIRRVHHEVTMALLLNY